MTLGRPWSSPVTWGSCDSKMAISGFVPASDGCSLPPLPGAPDGPTETRSTGLSAGGGAVPGPSRDGPLGLGPGGGAVPAGGEPAPSLPRTSVVADPLPVTSPLPRESVEAAAAAAAVRWTAARCWLQPVMAAPAETTWAARMAL